jgi:hypothetical protein
VGDSKQREPLRWSGERWEWEPLRPERESERNIPTEEEERRRSLSRGRKQVVERRHRLGKSAPKLHSPELTLADSAPGTLPADSGYMENCPAQNFIDNGRGKNPIPRGKMLFSIPY